MPLKILRRNLSLGNIVLDPKGEEKNRRWLINLDLANCQVRTPRRGYALQTWDSSCGGSRGSATVDAGEFDEPSAVIFTTRRASTAVFSCCIALIITATFRQVETHLLITHKQLLYGKCMLPVGCSVRSEHRQNGMCTGTLANVMGAGGERAATGRASLSQACAARRRSAGASS